VQGDSTNATYFLMADHASNSTWTGQALRVAFAPERPSSTSDFAGVRPVYAAPKRSRRGVVATR